MVLARSLSGGLGRGQEQSRGRSACRRSDLLSGGRAFRGLSWSAQGRFRRGAPVPAFRVVRSPWARPRPSRSPAARRGLPGSPHPASPEPGSIPAAGKAPDQTPPLRPPDRRPGRWPSRPPGMRRICPNPAAWVAGRDTRRSTTATDPGWVHGPSEGCVPPGSRHRRGTNPRRDATRLRCECASIPGQERRGTACRHRSRFPSILPAREVASCVRDRGERRGYQ